MSTGEALSGYQIADEPRPGALAKLAVNPVFPLLGLMLGGVWIAWPWFLLNGIAVGSPTLRREISWLAGGLAALFLIAFAILAAAGADVITGVSLRYALLVLVVAKIAVAYAVYVLQARTIEIYEYYGGVLNNGLWGLIIVFLIGRNMDLAALPVLLVAVLM